MIGIAGEITPAVFYLLDSPRFWQTTVALMSQRLMSHSATQKLHHSPLIRRGILGQVQSASSHVQRLDCINVLDQPRAKWRLSRRGAGDLSDQ